MEDKFKPVSKNEDGILTSLFRNMLVKSGLIPYLSFRINEYVRNGGSKNKASIFKIIFNGEMTWKSFMFLIFDILKVEKMTISIKLQLNKDKTVEHTMDVMFNSHNKSSKKEKDNGKDTNNKPKSS